MIDFCLRAIKFFEHYKEAFVIGVIPRMSISGRPDLLALVVVSKVIIPQFERLVKIIKIDPGSFRIEILASRPALRESEASGGRYDPKAVGGIALNICEMRVIERDLRGAVDRWHRLEDLRTKCRLALRIGIDYSQSPLAELKHHLRPLEEGRAGDDAADEDEIEIMLLIVNLIVNRRAEREEMTFRDPPNPLVVFALRVVRHEHHVDLTHVGNDLARLPIAEIPVPHDDLRIRQFSPDPHAGMEGFYHV